MTLWLWIGFILLVLFLLGLDLGVLNRKIHVIGTREALLWTAFYIALALLFNAGIYFLYEHHFLGIGLHAYETTTGREAAVEFFTGYVIEKSLSLDNIFVIAIIFSYFRLPNAYQHRVLFWGVLGALVMRGVMIGAGTALIHKFAWITYVFGALLIITAGKMLFAKAEHVDPDRNVLVRIARKLYPVSREFEGTRFFTRVDGRRAITPMLLVLLVVESTDVLFAVDSIPAIFGITHDPFLVFTSNVFAILGLRSLYFALAGIMDRFRYMRTSLVIILLFIGVKMMLAHVIHISTYVSLGVIAGVLAIGITASLAVGRTQDEPRPEPSGPDAVQPAGAARKGIKRILVLIAGSAVLLIGLVMLVFPGPAFIVIPAGLAILSTEFPWARRVFRRLKVALLKGWRWINPRNSRQGRSRRAGPPIIEEP